MDRRLAMKEMQLECQDGMHRARTYTVPLSVDVTRNIILRTAICPV